MVELNGPRVAPASGKAQQLVVFLHGYGADGNDLIGLAPHLQQVLPQAAFVSPNAPEQVPGSFGYQWFSLAGYDPNALRRDPADDPRNAVRLAGARLVAPVLDAFLDAELARLNLSGDRLALVGFSQGSMMALHVGLRRAVAPAAIVGFSGALIGPETLAAEIRSRPPVLLVHGDMDPVVPVEALQRAVNGLGAVGVTAQWHISRGVPHGIAPDGLQLASEFLRTAFASPA